MKRRSSLGASCNVIAMLHADWPPVDLVLENNHLGRGDEWVDSEDGIRKVFSVETLSVTVWHVLEFERHKVDDVSFGQLLDSDTYVLKWHYVIRQTGIRSLKGQEARQAESGRERCAYFFWQGANSSVNEKGASALMTVDLDQERGPQVRVSQGKEPAAFVRLFGGRMVIHRSDKTRERKPNAKLFISRNEIEAESYLQEISPCVSVSHILHENQPCLCRTQRSLLFSVSEVAPPFFCSTLLPVASSSGTAPSRPTRLARAHSPAPSISPKGF